MPLTVRLLYRGDAAYRTPALTPTPCLLIAPVLYVYDAWNGCASPPRWSSGRRHFTSYLIHTIPWMATPPPRRSSVYHLTSYECNPPRTPTSAVYFATFPCTNLCKPPQATGRTSALRSRRRRRACGRTCWTTARRRAGSSAAHGLCTKGSAAQLPQPQLGGGPREAEAGLAWRGRGWGLCAWTSCRGWSCGRRAGAWQGGYTH